MSANCHIPSLGPAEGERPVGGALEGFARIGYYAAEVQKTADRRPPTSGDLSGRCTSIFGFLKVAVLVQRFFTTQSGGGIGKPAHPNGAYKLAGPGQPRLGEAAPRIRRGL